MSIALDLFCLDVPFTMIFAAELSVTTGVLVVGGSFLLGSFTLMWTIESYKIIISTKILWQRPWCCAWYCIKHVLIQFIESSLILVFCFLVEGLGKSILQLYCVTMVLRGRKSLSKCVISCHYYCNALHHLDAMCSNLRNGWSVLLSIWWVWFELPPASWVPSTWWNKYLWHIKEIYHYFLEAFLINHIYSFSWVLVTHNLTVISIMRWGTGLGWVMPSFRFVMLKGMERCTYISWHGYLNHTLLIISSEWNSDIEFSIQICGYFVFSLQGCLEVKGAFFSIILHEK